MSPTQLSGLNSTGLTPFGHGSYFIYPDYSGLLLSHILLMVIAWFFILPISVMLSIVRSKFTLAVQFVFLSLNAIAVLLGTVHNSKTPDLYVDNAHESFGWVIIGIACFQVVLGRMRVHARKGHRLIKSSYQRVHNLQSEDEYRYSRDSGDETEPSSSRISSTSTLNNDGEDDSVSRAYHDSEHDSVEDEKHGLLGKNSAFGRFFSHKMTQSISTRFAKATNTTYAIIDRLILVLGFVGILSGLAVYGGIFRGGHVFSGMAHFVKGGIFFWYGLFTLGRYMGCFVDLGWAWNIKPAANIVGPRKAAMPSAEFVESFLIFFYGSTNVFLEHLGSWGKAWSAGDLEHVSISIMFFGGGLCGMLLESKRIKELLNSAFSSHSEDVGTGAPVDLWQAPRTYGFSLNPMPGIVILLLGIMMSSHHQSSMVSTMLHKQWGTLFLGAALARGVTYILTYLSPPTSLLPSRPPSEIVVAFCLISGGLIFMSSNTDMVIALEDYDLNAMFCFTVMMGFTAILMAWTIVVLTVKAWAIKRERRRPFPLKTLA